MITTTSSVVNVSRDMNNSPLYKVYENAFSLDSDTAYTQWRQAKLGIEPNLEFLELEDPCNLSANEIHELTQRTQANNFCLFRNNHIADDPVTCLTGMGSQLGLYGLDHNMLADDSGLTAITVKKTETDKPYIPYTNKPIGWHTDGYYNTSEQQIRGMLLFCSRPAMEGGVNQLMDHEIAYIRVRDENPEWIKALMAEDAFTIPANTENGKEIRPAHSGPVFSVDAETGALHMRYSARQRNVIWKDNSATRNAAAFLLELYASDDPYIISHRLSSGEGIISNNVLHTRSGFTDNASSPRLYYRARYYNRVAGT